jgi:serine/threonine-protein kinase RsbW
MTAQTLTLTFDSDPARIAPARKAIEQFAAEQGFTEAAVNEVGLCVNEAIANIIRHAYNGATDKPIELTAGVENEQLTINLRDWGNGRVPDIRKAAPPDPTKPKTLKPGGLGLPCLKSLLSDIQFLPQPDGMLLRMTKMKR